MTARPTAAVRERAAQLCSAMASRAAMASEEEKAEDELARDCGIPLSGSMHDFGVPCDALGVDCHADNGAASLARKALWSVEVTHDAAADWALACSMLRNGEVR